MAVSQVYPCRDTSPWCWFLPAGSWDYDPWDLLWDEAWEGMHRLWGSPGSCLTCAPIKPPAESSQAALRCKVLPSQGCWS